MLLQKKSAASALNVKSWSERRVGRIVSDRFVM